MKEYGAVDFHAHPVTAGFLESLKRLGIDPVREDGFPVPAWSAEAQLDFMRETGTDYAVFSPPTPHIHNGDDAKSCEAARKINLELSELVQACPKRFAFTAALPLPCVEGAVEETVYAMEKLGAIGVKTPTNSNGIYLGDKSFDPLMEELNRRGALAIIHPCGARQRPENVITGKVAAIFEFPADTTRAALNMIANRVMTRFPRIRWIVPHCGSFLPYTLQRFAGVSEVLAAVGVMEKVDIQAEFAKLYFDIAGDPEPVALDMLRMVADDSHIIYGSDFPYSPGKVVAAKKRHFDANPKYDGLRERIYRENASALLN